ncbi:rhamnogalacturonan acetylesterase [Nonomuraea soli]|uniref:Lysophospholipase L1-like esterase n=1 Tax=Nonomuraea soli TaxID=1032476 RepID=A0A7W0HS97_9ACTN|nr:rhamnogalacturonan acetylesterase [Nonomuraea soli]MBA2893843.1 lysophospholipase L1-like esterase [Nonomuraea soli]
MITRSFDLPPGHYDVTVRLGGGSAVFAQARRLMVAPCHEAGTHAFTVNVRHPEGQQNAFHGYGRHGLHLAFSGSFSELEVAPAAEHVRLFLAGDSTVTDQEHAPFTGWGQRLTRHFGRGVSVVNHSGSGENAASFLAKPELWAAMEPQLRPGDVVLVQFGHNDKRTTAQSFRASLTEIVRNVRDRGATPVLITPMVRRGLGPAGLHVNEAGADLPAVTRDVGERLIDLTRLSRELVEELGPDKSQDLYLTREEADDTHTSDYGATVFADLVAAELRSLDLMETPHWKVSPCD